MIQTEPEDIERIRERTRKMTNLELTSKCSPKEEKIGHHPLRNRGQRK
jgi:hypothetical protein